MHVKKIRKPIEKTGYPTGYPVSGNSGYPAGYPNPDFHYPDIRVSCIRDPGSKSVSGTTLVKSVDCRYSNFNTVFPTCVAVLT